jgi:hypothetical protein
LEELPLALLAAIPDSERVAVQRWWAELSNVARQEVVELCDERCEECFFGPPAEGEEQPVVIGGRFLPHDDAWRFADWAADWREYLTAHPDVVIAAQFRSRCFMTGCLWVDWSRTRFAVAELPPSERRQAEPALHRTAVK